MLVGKPAEVASRLGSARGEFTIVISGLPPVEAGDSDLDVEAILAAGRREGLSDRSLVAVLRAIGLKRREAYRRVDANRSR